MSAPNAVEVDRDAIDAELQSLEAGADAPAPASGPTSEPPAQEVPGVDWSAVMSPAVAALSRLVAPNWELTDEEQSVLADQGGAVLNAFFPNLVLSEKWALLCMFSLTVSSIAMRRYDEETGTLRPLRKPRPDDAKPDPVHVVPPAGEGTSARAPAEGPSESPPARRSVKAAPLARVPG